ncbi:hypothetical protein [Tenacibaculum singaporense]|uniref:Uncharacterized protein n=1 Tax=Tenacibaculum singaporense TaxID=2358479 RepID=A0A3S8R7R0_9FLAO|nr:hypothetical protein [Tenacibaculum singaporense]AZJ35806.1 hypothetical protein D6T69_09865 [Tenacibaculum singaporense]
MVSLGFKLYDKDTIESYQYEYDSGTTIEELSESFSKVEITDLYLSDYEYLDDRKHIVYEDFFQNSLVINLYSLLTSIICLNNVQLSELKYELNENYGYDNDSNYGFCEGGPNFIYKIHLSIEHIGVFDELVKTYVKPKINIPKFYWKFYQENKPLDDQSSIKILTTSTKARRLGYLVLLTDFFHLYNKVSASTINKKFEEFASQSYIVEELKSYKNDKGDVKITKTGISAKPYITLAEQIGLIKKINNVYSIGKKLKVYDLIRNSGIDKKEKHFFELDKFSKLFFFEELLKSDFLYLSILLELIYIKKYVSFLYLRDVFQQAVLNRLESFIGKYNLPASTKREIFRIRKRIENWDKPKIYLEHVLMPRINWLFDLGLIDFKDDKLFFLNESGKVLFNNLCYWYDIEGWYIVNPEQYISRFYQHIFTLIYAPNSKVDEKENFDLKELRKKINSYIEDSFTRFKTLAPNRVTLSQAIQYTKYNLFLKDEIPVEYKFIENHIKEHSKGKYIYKYQSQYGDGYVQKR